MSTWAFSEKVLEKRGRRWVELWVQLSSLGNGDSWKEGASAYVVYREDTRVRLLMIATIVEIPTENVTGRF